MLIATPGEAHVLAGPAGDLEPTIFRNPFKGFVDLAGTYTGCTGRDGVAIGKDVRFTVRNGDAYAAAVKNAPLVPPDSFPSAAELDPALVERMIRYATAAAAAAGTWTDVIRNKEPIKTLQETVPAIRTYNADITAGLG